MRQRLFQGQLHLHVTELTDGEVQVLPSFGAFVRVVLQQELC
jgi:hypothetical protein